jgi:hypothetical protein
MRWRTLLALLMVLLLAAAPGSAVFAGEIHVGATFQVQANSIWFQDAHQLTEWQALEAKGDAGALTTFEDNVLAARDAWRFTAPLDVKVLAYDPGTHQVQVEMETPGRMLGTDWFINEDALIH